MTKIATWTLALFAVSIFSWSSEPIAVGGEQTDDSSRSSDQPWNVLMIAVDDMRVEASSFGPTQAITPAIDRLAERGTRFLRAYCQQAVCNPSRASLLTGLRPDTLSVWDLPTHFRTTHPDVVTLPQYFKQNGYHAANIGKIFHNWRQDDFRGDALSWSEPAVMHYASHAHDVAQIDGGSAPDLSVVPRTEIRDVPDEAYFDGRIAALAEAKIAQFAEQQTPFFLAVGFWKPHAHFNAPKRYWDLYETDDIALPSPSSPPADVPLIAMHDSREILRAFKGRKASELTDLEIRTLRHGYLAAISYVDKQIGKVIAALDRHQLSDNTLIIFWSDHGFHLGEHGLWAKTSNFELDARVPLIMVSPSHPPGQRSSAMVELLDIYPTLVDLTGGTIPKGLEGQSLVPLLKDPKSSVKSAALTQHTRPAYPTAQNPLRAIGYSLRNQDFRYTEWRSVTDQKVLAQELYDHRVDPDESTNRSGSPGYRESMKQLQRELNELIGSQAPHQLP